MENGNRYGGLVQKFETGGGRIAFRKFKWALPAFIVLALIAWIIYLDITYGNIFEETWELALMLIPLTLAVVWPIIVFARIRFFKEVAVYEQGVTMNYGRDIISLSYDEIKGMSGMRSHSTMIWGVLPVWITKTMVIQPREGKEITLGNSRSPSLREMANVLNYAYTNHVIKDLSPERVAQAHFVFSPTLELKNGQFMFTSAILGNEEQIPLYMVHSLSESPNSYTGGDIYLNGPYADGRKGGAISIKGSEMLNFGILHCIIDNVQAHMQQQV